MGVAPKTQKYFFASICVRKSCRNFFHENNLIPVAHVVYESPLNLTGLRFKWLTLYPAL
jgi:hypothetical protein